LSLFQLIILYSNKSPSSGPISIAVFGGSFHHIFFTTPYLVLSMCLSLVYIHFYEEEIERAAGILPPYPQAA